MKVGIKDLKVGCIIGCLPEEEEAEQEILFDIEVEVPVPKDDRLENTLCYLLLKEYIESVAKRTRYHLIETLAHETASYILRHLDVSNVHVTVKKPTAVPNGRYAYATAILERDAR